eukprot:gnl/MRDRNA2_/MRDRNA2_177610_c0_seq1.p1 gnl/MRDRNA2_/MRDRNA2_177610_c0~~gnl/MRDRNA2_/MRDRNA2_177610_c0_seq1.p1  ORF type:complete len:187 (-),score=38.78 gnl/MRDRNA2_/MRDRNA2_177610_c0_seq1:37-597(-)
MGCGASSGKKYQEPPPVALNDLDDAPKQPPQPTGSSTATKEKSSATGVEKPRDTDKYRAENVVQDLEVIEGDTITSQPSQERRLEQVRLRQRKSGGDDQMPAHADTRVPDAQELLQKYAQQEAKGIKPPKKTNNSHIFAPSNAPFSNDVVRSGVRDSKSPARSPMDDHEVLANNQVGGINLRPKLK